MSLGAAVAMIGLLAGERAFLFIGLAVFVLSLAGSRRSASGGGSSAGRVMGAAIGGFLALLGLVFSAHFLVIIGIIVLLVAVSGSGSGRITRTWESTDYGTPVRYKSRLAEWFRQVEDRAEETAKQQAARTQSSPTSRPLPSHEPGTCVLFLDSAGPNKIGVIKVVRELTGFDLKVAKDLVDAAPVILREAMSGESADRALVKLRTAGATGRIEANFDPSMSAQVSAHAVEHTGVPQPAAPEPFDMNPGPFSVTLLSPGPRKIEVIKTLRDILRLSLSEAVSLTEHTPVAVREGLSGEAADQLSEALGAVGAVAEVMKPVFAAPAQPAIEPPSAAPQPPPAEDVAPAPPAPAQPAPVQAEPPKPAPTPPPTPTGPVKVPASRFDLILQSGGRKTMQVRQILKSQLGLDLLEAFNAVEKAPSVVKAGIAREEAERWRAVLEAEGAVMRIQPAAESVDS